MRSSSKRHLKKHNAWFTSFKTRSNTSLFKDVVLWGETVLTCPYWLDLNLRLIYLHSKLTKPSFSPSTLKLLTIIMCEISREAISSSFLWEWDRLTEGFWLNWQLVLCCCIWQTVTGRDLIPEVNAPLIGHERGSFILNQLANVID